MALLTQLILLRWLSGLQWATAEELAAFAGFDPGTVSRYLSRWLEDGLVVYRETGHLKQRSKRLLITSKGLLMVYPETHSHRGPDAHRHMLLGQQDPIDHSHPNYFNTKKGAETSYCRIELLEIAYSIAPKLFRGRGEAWSPDNRPLALKSWRWLKDSPFIEAIAEYEGGIRIWFVWVGQEMTMRMVENRVRNRFVSRDESNPLVIHSAIDGSDPYPSGIVVLCTGQWSAEMAKRAIRAIDTASRPTAVCYAIGPKESGWVYTGTVVPPSGEVAEWLDLKAVRKLNDAGAPEELGAHSGIPVPAPMQLVDLLSEVPRARAASRTLLYPGSTKMNLLEPRRESSTRMGGILEHLTGNNLVTAKPAGMLNGVPVSVEHYTGGGNITGHFDMHYADDQLLLYTVRRDRLSAKAIRQRANEEIHGDHKSEGSKIRHTFDFNRCMLKLEAGGYHPAPGYRDCLYLPGGKQLVPDARMRVTAAFGECMVIPMGNRAPTPDGPEADEAVLAVLKMLQGYSHISRFYPGKPLVCVCQDHNLIPLVQEEAMAFEFQVWAVLPMEAELGPPREDARMVRPVSVDLDLFIEYERTAQTKKLAREKLMLFADAAKSGNLSSLLLIGENEKVVTLFRAEYENVRDARRVWFPMVTATRDEILAGKKSGDSWVLDWMNVPLHHAGVDRQLDAI